jgi:glycolate oxidase FAD binding subunit
MVSRRLWMAIRDVTAFACPRNAQPRPLWRVSTAPTRGHELAARVAGEIESEVLYDWAGGLLWIETAATAPAAGADAVRAALSAFGGHATLVRAEASLRAALDVFEPLPAGLAALTKRIKEGFDPKGVLNPGRMWAQV